MKAGDREPPWRSRPGSLAALWLSRGRALRQAAVRNRRELRKLFTLVGVALVGTALYVDLEVSGNIVEFSEKAIPPS